MNIRKTIDIMVDKIIRNYHPERIILFGSYAYGHPTAESDVDLMIIKNDCRSPIERRIEIRRILHEENRFIPLTPLVYTPQEIKNRLELGDDFIEEIMTKGKILYAG